MKKRFLLLLVLSMNLFLSAQVTIQMEKDGGVYKVPCTVNGVKMKFIFDTGASSVCMSQTMAQFLLDGEYLSISDIKGSGQSVVADGTIVNHANIVLRDIEIGGLHIRNVQATVLESQNAPLLLGQTAISELGRITIDGNKLIIHTSDKELSDEQIEQLGEQARKHIDAGRFAAAIECIEKIDEAVGLSEYGLWELCFCYSQNNSYGQCIQACNRWIAEFEDEDEYGDKYFVYGYLAGAYLFGTKEYKKALLWYQKQADLVTNDEQYYHNIQSQAWCYDYMGNSHRAIELYNTVISYKLRQLMSQRNKDMKALGELIIKGKIQDKDLGRIYYSQANCYYDVGEYQNGDYDMISAAQLGYQLAQNYCIAHSFKQLYPAIPFIFR